MNTDNVQHFGNVSRHKSKVTVEKSKKIGLIQRFLDQKVMKESLEAIRKQIEEARVMDAQLVKKRAPYIRKNLAQIEGINRSEKYVYRLAGISPDVYRKSRNEMLVEWFGATAIENPAQALKFKAFWQQIFDFAEKSKIIVERDFWTTEEETDALLSQLRTSVLTGNRSEARNTLVKIIENAEEMLHQLNTHEMQQILIHR